MQIIQMLLFIQEKGHLGNREVNNPIDKIEVLVSLAFSTWFGH